MSTIKREIGSDQFPCAKENPFEASKCLNHSKNICSGNSNQIQHNLPSRAFTSQNDKDQQRRSDQQTCTNQEAPISKALSTAALTSPFDSLMVRLAADDFPAYVKQNTSTLSFPEKVRDLYSLLCTSYVHQTEPYNFSCRAYLR